MNSPNYKNYDYWKGVSQNPIKEYPENKRFKSFTFLVS